MIGIVEVEEVGMSKAPKVKRQERAKPDIPPPSAKDVQDVMFRIGLGEEKSEDVKECLIKIRDEYERDCLNLGFHITDKQLTDLLTRVRARAEMLRKVLDEDKAVRFALERALVLCSTEKNVSDRGQSERISADLDRDISAPSRLKDLASKALELHDDDAARNPDSYAIPSAEKEEDLKLVRNVWIAWQALGRSTKCYYELQRDSAGQIFWHQIDDHFGARPWDEYRKDAALMDFADRVASYIWRHPADPERVDYLFEKLQNEFEAASLRGDSASDTKGN